MAGINMYKIKTFSAVLAIFILPGIIHLSCKKQPDKISGNINTGQVFKADQNFEWFRDAKFGMFIHWGPYSRLAGEWNGQQLIGGQGEWIMKDFKIPVNEYRELAHKFNPVRFDAKEWVRLAKSTGMKYIVITAKHHDGFAMYKSKISKYNIVDWTKFGRDPLKELAEACAAEGIKFCVYYSHREDWDHPGGYGNDWDYDNDWGEVLFQPEKFIKYVEEKAKPQVRELLTNYGPIGLIWFDRGMYTRKQGIEFTDLVHALQPACLVNSRVGSIFNSLESTGDYQSGNDKGMPMRNDPSKSFPAGGLGDYWEAPQTLNETWGFNKFDTLWKSPETVIQSLVEIVSRGGNYLLNIGPTGEGVIPKATVDIFNKVGPWVQRNAESIYGTSANLFPTLPWGYTTVKGSGVYLFVRNWPKDGMLSLPGLKNAVKSAYLLLDKSVKLPFRQTDGTTIITLPLNPPDNPISVVVLETEGAPLVELPVMIQDTAGKFILDYLTAITHGKAKTRFSVNLKFHITKWTEPEDAVDWIIQVTKPGIFRVNISYAANKEDTGKPFEITDGSSSIKTTVLSAGDYQFHEFPLGYFDFPKAGKYTLTIRPLSSGDSYLMYMKSVTLLPVKNRKTEGWGVN